MADEWDPETDAPKTKCSEIRSCGDFLTWIKENPRRFAIFTVFSLALLAIAMAAAAFYLWDPDAVYAMSGGGGLFISIVGAFHFRTLLKLKEQVDEYSSLNKKFRGENAQLKSEVDRLEKAGKALKSTQKSIEKSIKINKQNVKAFGKLNKDLKAIGMNNLQEMGKINEMSSNLNKKWGGELVKKQRRFLAKVFERVEWDKNANGVTKANWHQFLKMLPENYRKKINSIGDFKKFAGDDECMQMDEFGAVLDKFAGELAN